MTRGDGSNHSHDFPNRLRNVLTEETVTDPEQRARINTLSLHQLTSTSGWYCSLSGAGHRGRMKQYGDTDRNTSEQRRRKCVTFSVKHHCDHTLIRHNIMTLIISSSWSQGFMRQLQWSQSAGGGGAKVWAMSCWKTLGSEVLTSMWGLQSYCDDAPRQPWPLSAGQWALPQSKTSDMV